MNVGDPDGHGQFGLLDETADGLLCHECGDRFTHLGLHAWKRHGTTSTQYRQAHGLARSRGLVAAETRAVITQNAAKSFSRKTKFLQARDPIAATAARLEHGIAMSPAGLAASRARPGRGRQGTVVTCAWCGAQFCPLTSARRRKCCSRSCSSRATRANPS